MQKVSMYRYAMEQFRAWKKSPDCKTLVIAEPVRWAKHG